MDRDRIDYEDRDAMKALRGKLSHRATSSEFNEWMAREICEYIDALRQLLEERKPRPQPADDWHEDLGPVMWWKFPPSEPPHVGTPLDCGQTVEVEVRYYKDGDVHSETHRHFVGGWPGYHTHFTPLPTPPEEDLSIVYAGNMSASICQRHGVVNETPE
jgi:hypothetical protein